jgi:hypothetical protein
MRVRIVSPTPVSDGRGRRHGHNEEPDLDDELARSWISAGHATPLDDPTEVDEDVEPAEPDTGESEVEDPQPEVALADGDGSQPDPETEGNDVDDTDRTAEPDDLQERDKAEAEQSDASAPAEPAKAVKRARKRAVRRS